MSGKKIVVAISGASGSVYAEVLLKKLSLLQNQIAQIGIVMTDNAKLIWQSERGTDSWKEFHFRVYDKKDFNAPFASGSAKYDAMIVVPCSMGTLGRIAHGISDDLITRAADVMLKERRKLILVTRDTPLSLIHINNMKTVTEAGGIICPASPSFYSNPKTIDEAAATVVDRVIDLCGLDQQSFRWGETK
jgi:4-hydroxy-3-polyprenylbenzoate decarboxylase